MATEWEYNESDSKRTLMDRLDAAADYIADLEAQLNTPLEVECRRCGKKFLAVSGDYCSRDCELGYTTHPLLRKGASA